MAEQDDRAVTDEETDAQVQALIDKIGPVLDDSTFGTASTALAVVLARVCADCEAPYEILADAQTTLVNAFHDFVTEPKEENGPPPPAQPASAN